ncbi:hypothetical protein [Actinocorallia longicatena]|uniref:Uncharacterized protein n=1 Tax=Actinocorallia longicatena TaxID=111803 RepID=A0ABP6QP30_9ACTN
MDGATSGDDRVDAALRTLDVLPETPVAGHVAIFDRVHQSLQDVLDGEPDQ